MKQSTKLLIITALLGLGVLVGVSTLARPSIVPADGPPNDFSAVRAMTHVRAISQTPHPPGSEELERVRTYIFAELQAMGLSPEVQESSIAVTKGSSVIATSVQNIVARIPGMNSSRAILLDAHYDTREMTPGASDCGSCVATLLETTRAILSGPALQNEIILLFTDNEEYGGGLGAAAFVESHPRADDVGLVLNFEGLGRTGPSVLFEAGPDSRWAVNSFGKVVSHPVGQSWFYEIYRLTPIGSDLNWFSEAGISGLNFGFWTGSTVYHTMLDNPEMLDPRSLQHHGSYALALTRHFGNQDMDAIRESRGDAIYFSLLPGVMVTYPSAWALPLAVLAGVFLIAIIAYGKRSHRITLSGTLRGLGGFFLSLLVSSGLATGIWMGVTQLHPEYKAMLSFRGMVYNAHFYIYAFTALAVAIAAGILVWLRKRNSVAEIHLGGLSFFWLLGLATSILLPGFSYLFTWPLLFSALALGWVFWRSPAEEEIAMMVGALPGLILFVPSIYMMFHFTPSPMMGAVVFMVALLLGIFIPHMAMLTRNHRWRLSWLALSIFVAFMIVGSLTASFDVDQPRPNQVAYLLDADTEEATWFSAGPVQDTWTRQFFTSEPERGTVGGLFPIAQRSRFPIWYGKAPSVLLEAPELAIIDDQRINDVRILQLRLRSPRGAPIVMLDVEPYEAVFGVIMNGERMVVEESDRDLWNLTYYAVPPNGFEITLELDPSQAIRLQISDQTWELVPEVLDRLDLDIQPRRTDMMSMPNFDYGTVVVKTVGAK